MPTTKPLPADLVAAFPELELRTTVRLHPRRGSTGLEDSKLGGQILWPGAEPWPTCPVHADPLVAVLQLRCEEVPELGCPDGSTVFQLLWCPKDHEEAGYGPLVRTCWRTTSGGGLPAPPPPPAPDSDPDLVPEPCRLFPERVVEMPDARELDHDTIARLDHWIARHFTSLLAEDQVYEPADPNDILGHANYWNAFSTAPGTKVGGFPEWIQDPEYPTCDGGHRMEHLLTVASAEFDGGTWWRWLPQEERSVGAAPFQVRRPVQMAADLMLGDMGNLYVFVCRACDALPTQAAFQCS